MMTLKPSQAIAAVCFVLALVGSFLPWATVSFFSVAGTRGDGKYTLIAAAVGGAIILMSRSSAASWLAAVAALLIAGVGIYDGVRIQNIVEEINATPNPLIPLNASVGEGLILVLCGGVGAVIACVAHAGTFPKATGRARLTRETIATCSECGAPNDAGALSCSSCGVAFEAPPQRHYSRVN